MPDLVARGQANRVKTGRGCVPVYDSTITYFSCIKPFAGSYPDDGLLTLVRTWLLNPLSVHLFDTASQSPPFQVLGSRPCT